MSSLRGRPLYRRAPAQYRPTTVAASAADDPALIGRLSLSVTRLARMLRQQEATTLTPAAASVLATVVRDGPISLGELASAERISPSTLTKLVSKLEAAGLVERTIDPGDRRVHRIQMAPRARRVIEAYRSKRNRWLAEQIALLGDDDRAKVTVVVELLERLTAVEGLDPVARGDILR